MYKNDNVPLFTRSRVSTSMEEHEGNPLHVDASTYAKLRTNILDTSVPVQQRLRTLYTLRALATTEAIDAAKGGKALYSTFQAFSNLVLFHLCVPSAFFQVLKFLPALNDESELLAHETAYCMGQMRNPYAIPFLIDTLKDEKVHPMVRHEVRICSFARRVYGLRLLKLWELSDTRLKP